MSEPHGEGRWIEMTLEARATDEEAAAAALGEAGALGVIAPPPDPGRGPETPIRLRAFFDRDGSPRPDALAAAVEAVIGPGRARLVGVAEVQDGRWAERYAASLRPFEIGERYLILPVEDPAAPGSTSLQPPGRLAIRLTPSRAFGTGEHPTTRLCLRAIESLDPRGSLLDAGTGSGILAIAAALAGHAPILAIDVDEEAIACARLNAGMNPAARAVRFVVADPSSITGRRYAAVVANLNTAILGACLPHLADRVAPGGIALLSGILRGEEEEIVAAGRALGLGARRRESLGDWSLVEMVKRDG